LERAIRGMGENDDWKKLNEVVREITGKICSRTSELCNYWRISLTSVACKVMEKILKKNKVELTWKI